MNLILSAKELDQMLNDSELAGKTILVDTRPFSEYLDGHIPGAINLDLMQFHWIDTSRIGIRQFNRQMCILFSNMGLTDSKRVAFYDNISGPSASRGVWLSHYLSQFNASILDGGFGEWKAKGLEIERKTNPSSHSKFAPTTNSGVLADSKIVKSSIMQTPDRKHVLLDCRSEQEFDGRIVRALKGGHIPSAINIDWSLNLEIENNGKFKRISDLDELYSGIPKTNEVITYCHGGYRAANTFVVLKMLGYDKVRMYLGSWGEWGNKPEFSAERCNF